VFLAFGSDPAIIAGIAIGETKPSHPSNTGPHAAFFIENEVPDGIESGQTLPRKSNILTAAHWGRPQHHAQS
jgi:hypothetical protein